MRCGCEAERQKQAQSEDQAHSAHAFILTRTTAGGVSPWRPPDGDSAIRVPAGEAAREAALAAAAGRQDLPVGMRCRAVPATPHDEPGSAARQTALALARSFISAV
jgi:hypothetical protein